MPLRSLDQAGLQRLPAVFPALTHLAFLEASRDMIRLVGHAAFLLICCLVLPFHFPAQTSTTFV